MDGFQKIDLKSTFKSPQDKKPELIKPMASRRKFKVKLTRRSGGIVVGILVFILLVIVFAVLPAIRTYKSGIKTYRQAQLVANAMKQQNVALASQELTTTKKDLEETQKNLRALSYMRFVPLVRGYYNDADSLVQAGLYGLDSAEITIDSVKPYADVLGLKGEGSFTAGSAEERIKTAVMTIGKVTPRIDEISGKLVLMREEVDSVNPDRYPEFIFGPKVKGQLMQLQELTDQSVAFVDEARPLIKVLPSLLGEKEEKKYLVLFQNDKELRPTGGFITAYAIFRIDKGIIEVERDDDIYNLDNSIPSKERAPEPILKYLPKVPTFNLRDSNLSPDFIESMKTFEAMYDKARIKVPVDGIIAIDTHVLVSTIRILDDQITVNGITFNTKNDERCDCPQVIYELEDNISRPVNYVKEDRKGLLGQLLIALMRKSLSSSPKQYWGPLFQSMLAQTNQKHIMFYLYDKDAQAGVEALNAAGRIQSFDGDYLHINDTNFGGAKANLFVDQEVVVDYDVAEDGTITKKLTIEYDNPHPPSDCNLERGGLCLNAELRDWLRIYVPKGSKMVDSKGSQVKMTTYDELGKTVFEGFVTVRPQGKKTFTISYTLPFKLEKGSPLPVLIQKQGGKDLIPHTINVNGELYQELDLVGDKELQIEV
jgi:hypothetical protein